jgi:glycosyltransferase involved in cell wall biosynthesis
VLVLLAHGLFEMNKPPLKFSIVTPAFNSAKFIGETIESVISQEGNFSIEYYIMDGGSADGTQEIVLRYQKLLLENLYPIQCNEVLIHWHSEKDNGMYDAVNKGFADATGDIFAYINSDDIYLPGAFDIIQRTLAQYPQILWLKGITSYMNENSTIYGVGNCYMYRQDWIKAGLYGTVFYFIQQDSVFWRAELWQKSGGLDGNLALAGDYFLWKSFAIFTPLYSLNAYVSCFRKTPDQKSLNIHSYWREIDASTLLAKKLSSKIRRFVFRSIETLPRFLRPLCYRLIFGQGKHYLVTLENDVVPRLWEGDYFTLKDQI